MMDILDNMDIVLIFKTCMTFYVYKTVLQFQACIFYNIAIYSYLCLYYCMMIVYTRTRTHVRLIVIDEHIVNEYSSFIFFILSSTKLLSSYPSTFSRISPTITITINITTTTTTLIPTITSISLCIKYVY
jgi:hypothetical protein